MARAIVFPVDSGMQSEDDSSDQGCNCHPYGMFAKHHHPDEEAAQRSPLPPSLSPHLVLSGFYSG